MHVMIMLLFAAAGSSYHYDAASSTCVNASGQQGLNQVDVASLFPGDENQSYPGVDAECADFQGVNFNLILGFGGAKLGNWQLAGANFTGAKLEFVTLKDADLRGAKLADLSYGYTQITGRVDAATTLPSGCQTSGSLVSCSD